jgi:two-component system cell cycle response regulator
LARKRLNGAATGRTVLVIDDNQELLLSTQQVIARAGHEVHAASGGAEGLAILATKPVDLVLVDYFMPVMPGEEFIRELRRSDRSLPVILQPGYANEKPPRELLENLDIQGYHDKNDGPVKLLMWVEADLNRSYGLCPPTHA